LPAPGRTSRDGWRVEPGRTPRSNTTAGAHAVEFSKTAEPREKGAPPGRSLAQRPQTRCGPTKNYSASARANAGTGACRPSTARRRHAPPARRARLPQAASRPA